ncbi:MAG: hypothetical protein ACFFDI_23680 [Promethearchaeota archaeon]
MNEENKSLILGLWFLCAIVCYLVGFVGGAIALVAIGAVLELTFWVVGFRTSQKQKKLMPTEFRCFNCKATINEGDEKCPVCGWVWKTFENNDL